MADWKTCVGLALAAGVLAQPATAQLKAQPDGSYYTIGMSRQEIDDQGAVTTAMVEFSQSGYGALHRRAEDLRRVMAHAPARFPLTETRGGYLVIRGEEADFDRLAKAAIGRGAKPGAIVWEYDLYPWAAYLIAQDENDQEHYEAANSMADRGLAWRPDAFTLLGEKGYALNRLHRSAEALAAYQRGLAQPDLRDPARVKLLKGAGFALIEMGRWTDAERAYLQAQKLAPNDNGVRDQLRYIADHKAR
jgi:tetratricopeptide (TPR) repeat protein